MYSDIDKGLNTSQKLLVISGSGDHNEKVNQKKFENMYIINDFMNPLKYFI